MNKDRFKDSMALLASGVSVLTCRDGERNFGITISSLTSIGIDPPTIAVCVEGTSSLLEIIRKSKVFAVTILSANQKDIGIKFADSNLTQAERFASTRFDIRENCPVIQGGLVEFVCDLNSEIEIAQNVVFFGSVRSADASPGRPLIYFDRNWHAILQTLPNLG